MPDVERRLRRIEDDRAIRDLKARYLRGCDLRDVDAMRDTLLPEGAVIAYDGFPPLRGRDAFLELFTQMACRPGLFDIHHGANGIIRFDGPDHASGQWSLLFHNIDLGQRSLTQMGVEYDDRYIRQDGRWWIAETRSKRLSCLIHRVGDDGAMSLAVMGDAPAQYGSES